MSRNLAESYVRFKRRSGKDADSMAACRRPVEHYRAVDLRDIESATKNVQIAHLADRKKFSAYDTPGPCVFSLAMRTHEPDHLAWTHPIHVLGQFPRCAQQAKKPGFSLGDMPIRVNGFLA